MFMILYKSSINLSSINRMKTFYLTVMISVSLLIWSDRMEAQGTGTKLNQLELIKQFVNNWKGEAGKDTTAFWEIKSSGTGLECHFKYVTKDKMIMEGNQLWSYDPKVDKFILTSGTEGMDAGSSALWFTVKNKCLITSFSDMSDPGKASFQLETEFKSPDMFVQKMIVNNKVIKTSTYNRVK
jgi:hypothetical protein